MGKFDKQDDAVDAQIPLIAVVSSYTYLTRNKSKLVYGPEVGNNLVTYRTPFLYHGHGIKAWENQIPYLHDFYNKNAHSVEHVWTGRVIPKPGIKLCSENQVEFDDGTTTTATHIICCFGYKPNLSFLPEWAKSVPLPLMYKLVFHPEDPSLSFIGYARPTFTSIPFMSEVQCMWASQVWSGKYELPTTETMKEIARKDLEDRKAFFPRYSNQNLVEPKFYVEDVLKCLDVNLLNKSMLKDWGLLYKLLGTPWSPLLIRVITGKYSKQELARLEEIAFPNLFGIEKLNIFSSIAYLFVALLLIGFTYLPLEKALNYIAKLKMNKHGNSMKFFKEKYYGNS